MLRVTRLVPIVFGIISAIAAAVIFLVLLSHGPLVKETVATVEVYNDQASPLEVTLDQVREGKLMHKPFGFVPSGARKTITVAATRVVFRIFSTDGDVIGCKSLDLDDSNLDHYDIYHGKGVPFSLSDLEPCPVVGSG